MTVVDPIRDERGWAFRPGPGSEIDPVNGFGFLAEAYAATDPSYSGRVTVPVLWDRTTKRIVSNNDDDIMRMFETEFDEVRVNGDLDFYPETHRSEIDALNAEIYQSVNNGVYRAGFATDQAVYAAAAAGVFNELDRLEAILAESRYLTRHDAGRNGLAAVRHADPLRCRLLQPFQMQSAPHRRLPQPVGLRARPLRVPRRRVDGQLRSHQAPLLHDAPQGQPEPDRTDRAAARPNVASRPRTISLASSRACRDSVSAVKPSEGQTAVRS